MELWVGSQYLLDLSAVMIFAAYFLIFNMTVLLTTFKDAAGIWHQDRFRPLFTSLLSVVLCLALIGPFGVYGVIVATPIAQAIIALPWVLHNLFSYLFIRDMLKSYLKEFFYLVFAIVVVSAVMFFGCSFVVLEPVGALVFRLAVCVFGFNLVFLLMTVRLREFTAMLAMFDRITSGRIGFIKRAIARLSR